MRTLLLLGLVVFGSSCATSSGVLPTGPDSYAIMKDGGYGATSVSKLKADIFREAGEFCTQSGKQIRITNTNDIPFAFGRPPHAELMFMCLKSNDPQYTRPVMQPVPNNIIEIRTPASH